MENINPDNIASTSENQADNNVCPDVDNVSQTVPLAALLEERKKYQRQIEDEKTLRQKYEGIFSALGEAPQKSDNLLKAQYDEILSQYGQEAANSWLSQFDQNNALAVQSQNQQVIREVQEKYQEIYAVPEVRQAIEAYLKLDIDPNQSLQEQGFPEAMEYISSIYKAGYESAIRLKSQNDAAKSRMGSSVTSAMPALSSGKIFSRAEISAMDAETFAQHEKEIFEQMAKGLIK